MGLNCCHSGLDKSKLWKRKCLVNIGDLKSQSEISEWVLHDRLSNPSDFCRRAKPDLSVDVLVDRAVEHIDPLTDDDSLSPSETPDRCETENLPTENSTVTNIHNLPVFVSVYYSFWTNFSR